jgi:hypothetical protein
VIDNWLPQPQALIEMNVDLTSKLCEDFKCIIPKIPGTTNEEPSYGTEFCSGDGMSSINNVQ